MQKTIAVGEFKAKCLGLLENVRAKKEGLIITKRGKPIARILPFSQDENVETSHQTKAGHLAGTLLFEGDIVSPLDEDWEANR